MKTIPILTHCKRQMLFMILFLYAASLLIGCDSFVEVDLPKSQLNSPDIFENYQTAEAALVDIYSKMRDSGILTGTSAGISYQLGNYADELTCFGNPSDQTLDFYNNALLPSNSSIGRLWNVSFNQIYAANAVLQGSKASVSLSLADKKKLEGEALFIRALLHFYLTGLFGEIPYITTTDYRSNSVTGKLAVDQVYKLIESDLQAAAALMTQVEQNGARIRPTRTAVYALLARVYLYEGLWRQAADTASLVLKESGSYSLEAIDTVFLKDSKETIWQFQPSATGKNTLEAQAFIFLTGPPPLVSLSTNLMDSFNESDLRKSRWTNAVTSGTSRWYHAFKYKKNTNTAVSVEYSIVFRLAEQYLIRAEAYAQNGDLSLAAEDLNKIRTRAGLANTPAATKEELLEAITQERRWELFTEYGHRFFDLRRSGKINLVLSAVKPGWNNTDILFPLPQTELGLNPRLLPQNNGY